MLQLMFTQWEWRVLTLPPRHFSWRVRGNALFWSMVERDTLEEDYDLLIATSMVDLATLRGLVPALARVPSVLYFHENQFAYPQNSHQHNLVEAQVTSIYSALAAEKIVFNSHYNHDTFMAGCSALLQKLPDFVPPSVVPQLAATASVLPVPLDDKCFEHIEPAWPGRAEEGDKRPLRLLWVGRFEHDKGPEGLRHILRQLEEQELDYELAMVGQQFRQTPRVFSEIQATFAHRLAHYGFLESPARYRALLQAADVVLSTAIHEFQGLAVMEAVAAGALPVVPNRLVYPQMYCADYCYTSCPDDPQREAGSAAALITALAGDLPERPARAPDMTIYSVNQLAPRYEAVFACAMGAQDSH
ncbi:Glycogen synthase [Halioglobus japonicus]|nr:Glycogen synthase [Halioglobus japonicus]